MGGGYEGKDQRGDRILGLKVRVRYAPRRGLYVSFFYFTNCAFVSFALKWKYKIRSIAIG